MSPSISEIYFGFPERNLPGRQAAEYVAHSQNDFYFQLAALKATRIKALQEHFSRTKVKKLLLTANLSGFSFADAPWEVEFLEKGFFLEQDPAARERKRAYLEDCVVILNNNDVGQNDGAGLYADFFCRCDKTVFIAWDWDNHHWLDLSTFLAAHSDLYAPAHHENLFLLTRFNWLTTGPVYCGSVQWPKEFLCDHLQEMIETKRSNDPLGKHIPYGPFKFRNQVVATLSSHYPSVGFSDRNFHVRTSEDRLKEWCSHKSHWIMPVLNDVPIRIFDALVTGGIPMVPESLRFLPPVRDIDREHIVFYTPLDIVEPKNVVAKAKKKFDQGGRDGIMKRHLYALEQHHGDARVKQMLDSVQESILDA